MRRGRAVEGRAASCRRLVADPAPGLPQAAPRDVQVVPFVEAERLQPRRNRQQAELRVHSLAAELRLREAPDRAEKLAAQNLQPGQDVPRRKRRPLGPLRIELGCVDGNVRSVLAEDPAETLEHDLVHPSQVRQVLARRPGTVGTRYRDCRFWGVGEDRGHDVELETEPTPSALTEHDAPRRRALVPAKAGGGDLSTRWVEDSVNVS